MKNMTDFRKTVETAVDPRLLIFRLLTLHANTLFHTKHP